MLPLAHTYISTKVTGRKDPMLLVGSVIPDLTSISNNLIKRELIHNSPYEIYDYVKNNYPDSLDLGLGILLHCEQSKGADYYSDDFKVGYAYLNGLKVNDDVSRLLGMESENGPHVLSHNFIELALDLLVSERFPETASLYEEAQESINWNLVSEILSNYLSQDKDIVDREIKKFINTLSKENLVNRKEMLEEVTLPLIELRTGVSVDKNDTLIIVDKSIELIKDTYEDFLSDVIDEMKTTFESYV